MLDISNLGDAVAYVFSYEAGGYHFASANATPEAARAERARLERAGHTILSRRVLHGATATAVLEQAQHPHEEGPL